MWIQTFRNYHHVKGVASCPLFISMNHPEKPGEQCTARHVPCRPAWCRAGKCSCSWPRQALGTRMARTGDYPSSELENNGLHRGGRKIWGSAPGAPWFISFTKGPSGPPTVVSLLSVVSRRLLSFFHTLSFSACRHSFSGLSPSLPTLEQASQCVPLPIWPCWR